LEKPVKKQGFQEGEKNGISLLKKTYCSREEIAKRDAHKEGGRRKSGRINGFAKKEAADTYLLGRRKSARPPEGTITLPGKRRGQLYIWGRERAHGSRNRHKKKKETAPG